MSPFKSAWVTKKVSKLIESGKWSVIKGKLNQVADDVIWVDLDDGKRASFIVQSTLSRTIAQEGDDITVWAIGNSVMLILNRGTGRHIHVNTVKRRISEIFTPSWFGILFFCWFILSLVPGFGIMLAWGPAIVFLIMGISSFRPIRTIAITLAVFSIYFLVNGYLLINTDILRSGVILPLVFAGNLFSVWFLNKIRLRDLEKIENYMVDFVKT